MRWAYFAVVALAASVRASAAEAGQYEATKGNLDALLADYRAYDLPMPPADARLVRVNHGVGTRFKGVTYTPSYIYAFTAAGEGVSPDGRRRVSLGLSEVDTEKPVERADGKVFDPDLIRERCYSIELGNRPLVVAVQCHARGHTDLARAIIRRSVWGRLYSRHFSRELMKTREAPNLQALLAATATDYWYRQVRAPDSDWRVIERYLSLIAKRGHSPDPARVRYAIDSLRASFAPSQAKPGSIEAMIGRLVDMRLEFGTIMPDEVTAPEYLRLLERGFDAVPALIEHLDDERMTRSVMVGFNNFPTYSMRLGQLAHMILADIAARDFDVDWLRLQKGYVAEEATVETWWQEAQETTEREWMLEHLSAIGDRGMVWVLRGPIRVVARKYREDLPRAVEALAKAKAFHGWEHAVAAVLESELDVNAKASLLRKISAVHGAASDAREGLFVLSLVSNEVIYDGKLPHCIHLPLSDDSPLRRNAGKYLPGT